MSGLPPIVPCLPWKKKQDQENPKKFLMDVVFFLDVCHCWLLFAVLLCINRSFKVWTSHVVC